MYDVDGVTQYGVAEYVMANQLVTIPPVPTRDGNIFTEWYKDEQCMTAWDFSADRVKQDTTLYAKWREVTVPPNDDTPTEPDPTAPDPTVPVPTVPDPTVPRPTVPGPMLPSPIVPRPSAPVTSTVAAVAMAKPTAVNVTPHSISSETKNHVKRENSSANISGDGALLGGFAATGVWSLTSLILSTVALLLSIAAIVRRFLRKDESGDENTDRKSGTIPLIATVATGLLTGILWFILDDFDKPMAWISCSTLYVALLFIAHIILLIVHQRMTRTKNNEAEVLTTG
jgi:uncharacterized repeat protein (TIGR02543 family)